MVPKYLLALFGMTDPIVLSLGRSLLAFLSVSGLFITVALSYTGGLQGTGDTRSPLYISIVSQVVIPLGLCTGFKPPAVCSRPTSGSPSSSATSRARRSA